MSNHSFNPQIAAQVGLNAAVLYQNLTFWVEKNQANRRNFRKDRYWTYNSISAFAELFPYLTEKQIRTALDKLLDAKLILKGQFSDDKYDRTTWYALNDPICLNGHMDMPDKSKDAFAHKGKPVAPEGKSIKNRYKPDNKPYPSRSGGMVAVEDLEKIWLAYPEDRRRGKFACLQQISAVLNEVSPDELFAAVSAYASESASFTRSKVCFADNWFANRKWERHLADLRAAQSERAVATAKLLAQAVQWIKSGSEMCRHVTPAQVSAALKEGMLKPSDAIAAGFRI